MWLSRQKSRVFHSPSWRKHRTSEQEASVSHQVRMGTSMVIHPPLSPLNKQQSGQPASKQSTAATTTGPHHKRARLDAVDHHGKESTAAQQSGSCAPRATSHFAQHKQQCTPTLHHESLTTHAPCRRGRTQAMPKHTPPCCKLVCFVCVH